MTSRIFDFNFPSCEKRLLSPGGERGTFLLEENIFVRLLVRRQERNVALSSKFQLLVNLPKYSTDVISHPVHLLWAKKVKYPSSFRNENKHGDRWSQSADGPL